MVRKHRCGQNQPFKLYCFFFYDYFPVIKARPVPSAVIYAYQHTRHVDERGVLIYEMNRALGHLCAHIG